MSDLIDSLNQTFDMETNQMKHDKENFPIQSTVNRIAQIIGYQSLTCDFHLKMGQHFMVINCISRDC